MYAVVKQPTSVNKGLVTAKARLAKQGLMIPRRELVLGHMAVNLLSNVQDALQGFPVSSLHCWCYRDEKDSALLFRNIA